MSLTCLQISPQLSSDFICGARNQEELLLQGTTPSPSCAKQSSGLLGQWPALHANQPLQLRAQVHGRAVSVLAACS